MGEYDKAIVKVLLEAGHAGISVQKISRHVYNSCNSLFNPVSFQDVHHYVSQYLLRNSKAPTSTIARADTRGVYRLNLDNQESRQLYLQFTEQEDAVQTATPEIDLSLSLF
ncbi:MAG: hypothetical protein IJV36_01900 [Prevotella sp.]|nr:hypothetical protein [Prevotella sp.]